MFQRGMLKKEGKRGERGFTKRDAWREVHKIGFAVGLVWPVVEEDSTTGFFVFPYPGCKPKRGGFWAGSGLGEISVVQVGYNLLSRSGEEALRLAKAENLGSLIRAPVSFQVHEMSAPPERGMPYPPLHEPQNSLLGGIEVRSLFISKRYMLLEALL